MLVIAILYSTADISGSGTQQKAADKEMDPGWEAFFSASSAAVAVKTEAPSSTAASHTLNDNSTNTQPSQKSAPSSLLPYQTELSVQSSIPSQKETKRAEEKKPSAPSASMPASEPAKTGWNPFSGFLSGSKSQAQPDAETIKKFEDMLNGANTKLEEEEKKVRELAARLTEKQDQIKLIHESYQTALEQPQTFRTFLKKLDEINDKDASESIEKMELEMKQSKEAHDALDVKSKQMLENNPIDSDFPNTLSARLEKEIRMAILAVVIPIARRYADKEKAHETIMLSLQSTLNEALAQAETAKAAKIQIEQEKERIENDLASANEIVKILRMDQ